MRTKDIDVFLLSCLKAKEWFLGPPVSITWCRLSVEGNRIKLGAAEMEQKGTKTVKVPVPSLESPGESLFLVLCILTVFFCNFRSQQIPLELGYCWFQVKELWLTQIGTSKIIFWEHFLVRSWGSVQFPSRPNQLNMEAHAQESPTLDLPPLGSNSNFPLFWFHLR